MTDGTNLPPDALGNTKKPAPDQPVDDAIAGNEEGALPKPSSDGNDNGGKPPETAAGKGGPPPRRPQRFWQMATGLVGMAATAVCLWVAAFDEPDRAADTPLICRHPEVVDPTNSLECVESALKLPATPSDRNGKLRIVGVYPAQTEMNHHIVAVVAGVVSVEDEEKTKSDPAPIALRIFLNNADSKTDVLVRPVHASQVLRFRLDSPEDYKADNARFFRELFSGVWSDGGSRAVTLGLSRSTQITTLPDATALADMRVTVQLFTWGAILPGILAILSFAAWFVLFARQTTVLRENKLTVRELRDMAVTDRPIGWTKCLGDDGGGTYQDADAVGPYSLGLTQMAIWAFLVIAGFLYITLTLGQFENLMNKGVLALLGLTGITSIAASQINGQAKVDEKNRVSRGFIQDIMENTDQTGPQFQRIQAFVWTFILGGIFLWIAATTFSFINFDANLLLLMGLVNFVYLGFKVEEVPKAPKPDQGGQNRGR